MVDNIKLEATLDTMVAITQTAWRKTIVMPRLVDNRYDPELRPANKGESVSLYDVKEFGAAEDVVPGPYPVTTETPTPSSRPLTLDYHKHKPFPISNADLDSIDQGVAPRTLQRALNSVAEAIDTSIYKEAAKYAYQIEGSAGTTPYASNIDILTNAVRKLTTAKADKDERYHVLDEFAMQNASKLTTFLDADKAGPAHTLLTGQVAFAYGLGFYESNNVPIHTTTATGNYAIDAAGVVGNMTITVDNAAGALPAPLVVGDVLSIAGSTQTYTVTSYTPGTTDAVVGIFPALDQTIADADVVTVTASHKLNLVFQRESIAFASRPYVNSPQTSGVLQRTIPDPESGTVLTLRVQDGWYQTYWSISALWGVTVVPEKEGGIVRILG